MGMQKLTGALTLVAIILGCSLWNIVPEIESETEVPPFMHTLYSKWRVKYGILRSTPSESNFRLSVFYKNYLEVQELRKSMPSAIFVLNQWSDMTIEEKDTSLLGMSREEDVSETITEEPEFVKEEALLYNSVWVAPSVRPPMNQGTCGSCWAWAAKHSTETILGGVEVSAQHTMNCNRVGDGCQGKDLPVGLETIKSFGYRTWSEAPYLGRTSSCQGNSGRNVDKKIYVITPSSAAHVKDIVSRANTAPIVGVNALGPVWYNFGGGVMDNTNSACRDSKGNHAVTLIGYHDQRGIWTIKNSWGTNWGNNGFIDIKQDSTMKSSCFCGDLRGCRIVFWG